MIMFQFGRIDHVTNFQVSTKIQVIFILVIEVGPLIISFDTLSLLPQSSEAAMAVCLSYRVGEKEHAHARLLVQANRKLQNWKCSLNQSGDKRGRWRRTLAVIVRSHWPHAQPTHGDWRAKAATNRWEWLPYLLLARPRATPRPGAVPTAGRDLWGLLVRARPPRSCLRV
ncbi:hypothetical protein MUK42_34444 [Musa troglodytarum]|uniref:Uncharacterized protein n=1 Tax=Musa troglodytarum TaxID=320322 RepID=A0A9E7KUN5_9LILI|nr:hypothetical protein MUK42_34444 [Musa troglodytarum]